MIHTVHVVKHYEWLELTKEFTPLLAQEAKDKDFWWEREIELDHGMYQAIEDDESSRYYVIMVDEEVAGYLVVLCFPMMRCKGTLHAVSESLYIHPDYRSGGTYNALLKFAEKDLKSYGIPYLTIAYPYKDHKLYARMMGKKGYTPSECSFTKEL